MNRNVTIVIDGQAGSCGKGKICGYIAQKDNIEIATKVKEFITKIEKLTNVPVTMIGTGERNCDMIDLR